MRPKWLLFFAQACALGVFATTVTGENPPVVTAEAPAIQFQVLEQKRVQAGDHAVILNRVVPPILPPAPVVVAPTPVEPEQILELKSYEFVFLSATVYDRQVTELRWFSDRKTFHVFSNIDFNFICGVGQFETADTIYSLMLSCGNESREVIDEANREAAAQGVTSALKSVPELSQFPKDYSNYVLADDSADDAQAFAALDALHAYYDANREQLQTAYAEREAARIEKERLQAAQPAKPKDTVINYWIGQGATTVIKKKGTGGRP